MRHTEEETAECAHNSTHTFHVEIGTTDPRYHISEMGAPEPMTTENNQAIPEEEFRRARREKVALRQQENERKAEERKAKALRKLAELEQRIAARSETEQDAEDSTETPRSVPSSKHHDPKHREKVRRGRGAVDQGRPAGMRSDGCEQTRENSRHNDGTWFVREGAAPPLMPSQARRVASSRRDDGTWVTTAPDESPYSATTSSASLSQCLLASEGSKYSLNDRMKTFFDSFSLPRAVQHHPPLPSRPCVSIDAPNEQTPVESAGHKLFALLEQYQTTSKASKIPNEPQHEVKAERNEFLDFDDSVEPSTLFADCKKLEGELRQLMAQRSSSSQKLFDVRDRARALYVNILMIDLPFASAQDVNTRLWMLHRKYLEIFTKKLAAMDQDPNFADDQPRRLRYTKQLEGVLLDATTFYSKFLAAFYLRYGLTPPTRPMCGERSDACHTAQFCGIVLGDLARYDQQYSLSERKQWGLVEAQYTRSLLWAPGNGKCYNQLALVSVYRGVEIDAVYRYVRAMAAAWPFKARENLGNVFTKNKEKKTSTELMGFLPGSRPNATVLLDTFLIEFVRLHAILFSRQGLENFETVCTECFRDFRMVLELDVIDDALLLKLFVVNMFSVIDCLDHADGFAVTSFCLNDLSPAALCACQCAYECAGWVVRTAATTVRSGVKYLGPITLFLDWLQCFPALMCFEDESKDYLRAGLSNLLNALNEARIEDSTIPTPLAEDLELQGFLPLLPVLARRLGNNPPQQPPEVDEEESLFVRVGRLRAFARFAVERPDLDFLYFNAESMCYSSLAPLPPPPPVRQDSAGGGGMITLPAGVTTDPDYDRAGVIVRPHKKEKQKRPSRKPQRPPGAFVDGVYVLANAPPLPDQPKLLVVIDAPNVAMRHGTKPGKKTFSTAGIKIVADYYRSRGHKIIAFLPDFYCDLEAINNHKRMAALGWDVPASKMPDQVTKLQEMCADGTIVLTPSQDYDDSYCIQHAKAHGGVIVTNDRYRDHIDKLPPSQRFYALSFLRTHCISFTFVGDEFLPNPDFVFPAVDVSTVSVAPSLQTGTGESNEDGGSSKAVAISSNSSVAQDDAQPRPQPHGEHSVGGVDATQPHTQPHGDHSHSGVDARPQAHPHQHGEGGAGGGGVHVRAGPRQQHAHQCERAEAGHAFAQPLPHQQGLPGLFAAGPSAEHGAACAGCIVGEGEPNEEDGSEQYAFDNYPDNASDEEEEELFDLDEAMALYEEASLLAEAECPQGALDGE